MKRSCLNCGMETFHDQKQCLKCDDILGSQSDGSTLTYDIAHQGERVREAVLKLENLMAELQSGNTSYLRLIVGSGLIRDEISYTLGTLLHRKEILSFEPDGRNSGAILIHLK